MSLSDLHLLSFVDDLYEDLELWYPKLRLREEGIRVTTAGLAADHKYVGKHGYPCISDAPIHDLRSTDFQGVVIPGGFMPDRLRREAQVLKLVREMAEAGKLVAAICHGGWIPISAGIYRGVPRNRLAGNQGRPGERRGPLG